MALGDALSALAVSNVVASLLFACLGVFGTMLSWREMLAAFGAPLSVRECSRIYFLGQLGKYLPGSVWPILAQAELARRTGTARTVTVAANLVSTVASLATGVLLGFACLPFTSASVFHKVWWLLLALPVLLACLHPRVIMAGVNLVLRIAKRAPLPQTIDSVRLLRAIGVGLVAWLMLGAHVYFLVASLSHHGLAVYAASVGAITLATTAGLLFIPAPAGAGIREIVLTLALAPVLTSAQALSVALVSRVALILVDFLFGGGQALFTRQQPNPTPTKAEV